MDEKKLYESIHNYTKYKLIEMLIIRFQDDKLNLDNLNSIEELADEILETFAISGMKFYQELRGNFNENRN
jgi:hypothetical protein|tara:strand:- start:20 stop:232 length:213 start_codon:yes stop_codon:yes gene_type:complete